MKGNELFFFDRLRLDIKGLLIVYVMMLFGFLCDLYV